MKQFLILIVFVLLCCSCANEVAPTGGPKDVTPPKIIQASPKNYSTNFNYKNVEIQFDEFFQLNNYKQKLVISPPFQDDPTFTIKGKKLNIKINEQLQPNTTYKIFLDDALVDYNEGNVYNNFEYVFSTGNIIDSMSFKGCVIDAFTHKPVENALVCLYDNLSDTAFTTISPKYVAKTNKEGNFIIEYLKDTIYNIFAITNVDKHLYYSLPTENIAFYDSIVNPHNTSSINLLLFHQQDTIQQITDIKTELNKVTFMFKFPTKDPKIKYYKNIPDSTTIIYNSTRDTVKIFTNNDVDTLFFIVYDNNQYVDSLRAVVKSEKLIKNSKLTITPNNGNTIFYKNDLILKFNNIIKDIFVDSLLVIKKEEAKVDTTYEHIIYSKQDNHIKIDYQLQKKCKYNIIIPDSAFSDIVDNYNKKYIWTFSVIDEDNLGSIVINLFQDSTIKDNTHVIVQLLDEKGNSKFTDIFVTLNNKDTTKLVYPLLYEGKYKIRIIYDSNNDKKWTSGNYMLKIQPERIIYSKDIEVKKKWDIEETIVLN